MYPMTRKEPRKGGATGGIVHTRPRKPRKKAESFVMRPIHTANMTVSNISERNDDGRQG